jgi:hypothetical protein
VKKLLALMNLVAIKVRTVRMAATRQVLEFLDTPLRIISPGGALRVNRVMLAFIGLNQRDQDFQFVALRATYRRSPKRFDAP